MNDLREYINYNGWTISFEGTKIYWKEINPVYEKPCPHCNSTGFLPNPTCQCIGGLCMCNQIPCYYCKKGYQKSPSKFPAPDKAILDKLAKKMRTVIQDFANELESGELEKEIKKEKALNASIASSAL